MAKGKKETTKTSTSSGKAWSFTGAFTLLGLGVGILRGEVAAGLFIGIGFGLLVTSWLRYRQA